MLEHLPPLPMIRTPFSKVDDHWLHQQGTKCSGFELDYYRCAARVGHVRSETECKLEYEDMQECSMKTKQMQRYALLQAERRKQKAPFLQKIDPDCISHM